MEAGDAAVAQEASSTKNIGILAAAESGETSDRKRLISVSLSHVQGGNSPNAFAPAVFSLEVIARQAYAPC